MSSNYPPGTATGRQGSGIDELECPQCHTRYGVAVEYELGGTFLVGQSEDVATDCFMCGTPMDDAVFGPPSVTVPRGRPRPEPYGPSDDGEEPRDTYATPLTYVAFAGEPEGIAWTTLEGLSEACEARGGVGFVPEDCES